MVGDKMSSVDLLNFISSCHQKTVYFLLKANLSLFDLIKIMTEIILWSPKNNEAQQRLSFNLEEEFGSTN